MLCEYTQEDIKRMAIKAHKQYQNELNKTLMLDDHLNELCSRAYIDDAKFQNKNRLYKEAYPKVIKIAPSVKEIFNIVQAISGDIKNIEDKYSGDSIEVFNRKKEFILECVKPKKVITLEAPLQGNLWWGDTLSGINLRPGLINNDTSKPYWGFLGGQDVHALVGGNTGQGKSVLSNTLLVSAMYEYAPWELCLWMCDMKMLEFGRYTQSYKCPHIKVVAATQSVDYIVSVYKEFDSEMKMLYDLTSVFNSQSLEGIRSYLGMAMPRNYLYTDELSQAYANGTAKQITYLNNYIQSIAKLGRAVGYHMTCASQNYKGTIPGDVISQFTVGVAVGCAEDTSEALIGNKRATELLTKQGYCIFNPKKDTKDEALNVEFKVAFWDDKSDEAKIGFQEFLKIVCDVGQSIGVGPVMEDYSEKSQRNYRELERDIKFVESMRDNSGKVIQNLMCTLPLGSYMKFTGVPNNVAYFNLEYARRQNIFINSTSVDKIKYMCHLVGDSLNICRPDLKHAAIVDNTELFDDYVNWLKRDLTGDFTVEPIYNACLERSMILKYNLACKGLGTKPDHIGYLRYIYGKKKQTECMNIINDPQVLSLVDNCSSLDTFNKLNNIYQTNTDDLVDDAEKYIKSLKGLEIVLTDLKGYNMYMSSLKSTYIEPKDFSTSVYWLFEPLLNEGIVRRGAVTEMFENLLAIGPSVGVFFIVVTTDARGMKKSLFNARHCIISSPQSNLLTFLEEDYTDGSGIGCKYIFVEGDDDSSFYFKRYFTG